MLTLLCALLAAQPVAELSGDAAEVQFQLRGAAQKHLRVARGGSFSLKLDGPAELSFDVRVEALAPRADGVKVERDGKPVTVPALNAALDPSVRSDKGQALSRATSVPIPLEKGSHTVTLRWPKDASGDGLVLVNGATLQPALALPDLPLALPAPLPLPPVAEKKPAAVPASDKTLELAPLTGTRPAASASKTAPLLPSDIRQGGAQPLDFQRFELEVRAAGLRSAETYTGPVALGAAGAGFGVRVKPLLPIWADLDLGFSHQGYQARQLAPGHTGLASTDLDERRIDGLLAAGWDLGPWARKDGRLTLMPYLGAQYTGLRNGGFPLNLLGPAAGAKLRWALSSAFALQGGARFSYNLLKGDTLSAVGTPVSDLLLEGGISLPLAGGYAFDLGYRGDLLALKYDTRVAHGMAVSVHTGF